MPQMNDIDYRLAMICGTDLPVPECTIIVH